MLTGFSVRRGFKSKGTRKVKNITSMCLLKRENSKPNNAHEDGERQLKKDDNTPHEPTLEQS